MRRYIIGIILGLLTFVLFFPVVRKGMVPIPADYMLAWYEPWKTEYSVNGVPAIPHKPVVDDAFRHLYPLRVVASRMMRDGAVPLWNPYNAAGTPLLAIMHPGYFTPFGIFFLFFPSALAWTIYVMAQPVVLGLSVYWYARKLRLSTMASIFTSVTLLLSGFSIVRLEYGEFLYVLTGLPLLLGIVEVCKKTPENRIIFFVPIITGGMLLSGQPHMIIYTLVIFALYAMYRLPLSRSLRLGVLAALGIAIAAVQLVPSIELYAQSTINRTTSAFIFDRFLLPVSHLITIIIPNYFGNQATYNYFGQHDYTETVAYVGLLPVFFASIALWYIRTPIVRFFLAVTVFSILMTMQWFGAKLLFSLPIPVLSSDVPSRIFVLSTFAVSVLGGIGFSVWETLPWKKVRPWFMWSGGIVGAILIGTGALYFLHVACPTTVSGCRMVSLRTTLIETAGFAIFVMASVFALRFKGLLRIYCLGIPLAVIFLLGTYNARKFLPFSPAERVFPDTPMFSEVRNEVGNGRFFGVGSADFRTNLTTYYGLYSVQYFDPLHIRRYAELVSFVNTGDRLKDIRRSDVNIISDATVSAELSVRREKFLDMTGTRMLLAKKSEGLPGPVHWENPAWQMMNRPSALARAYLVTDVRLDPDPDHLLNKLFSDDTNIENTAFVETPVSGVDVGSESGGMVTIDSYLSNSIDMSVTSQVNAFLVFSDTYYPGWRATVDGADTKVYRTNYAFRGIVVPKGARQVRFFYDPDSFKLGAIISVLSIATWGVAVLYSFKKKKR